MRKAKPPASDRTIDLFSGKTAIEVATGNIEAPEDVVEATKESETIEQAADRWRANALFTAETLSVSFGKAVPDTESFRLTEREGLLYLERLKNDGSGKAYTYAGLTFNSDSLYELANMFYKAAKEKKLRDGNIQSN